MTSCKFHALLIPTFCYLFYFRDHTYSASLELVILSLVLRLSPPSSATCPPVWAPPIPPSLPFVVAFVTSDNLLNILHNTITRVMRREPIREKLNGN